MEFREAIERDAQDLQSLADSVAAGIDLRGGLAGCSNDYREQERRLDAAAMRLRRTWLGRAHRPADVTLKSPRQGRTAHLPCGEDVQFGYERELDVSLLERRGAAYLMPPPGWSSDLMLCRSGQSALSCFLQFAMSRWGETRPLRVAHAGAYFETAALLASWPQRVLQVEPNRPEASVDVLVVEPVWCDGLFGRPGLVPAARHAILIDTTMSGPGYDLAAHLPDDDSGCDLVIAYSSGLKLDQAGLELANVGIVRILARDGEDARKAAADLRHIRDLTGSGLTLDELSALSAPWFMDRGYVDRYTAAIFANNRALAAAVGPRSAVFASPCHPSLLVAEAEAPFCALQLGDASADDHRRLLRIVEREIERRGLLATCGGSFGFRGHRFELIEPDAGQGRPFLRVAMGFRAGHSRDGLCDLFAELAGHRSFAALDGAYGR